MAGARRRGLSFGRDCLSFLTLRCSENKPVKFAVVDVTGDDVVPSVYVRESDCKAARELLHSLIGALEVLGNNTLTPLQPKSALWNAESTTLLIDSR